MGLYQSTTRIVSSVYASSNAIPPIQDPQQTAKLYFHWRCRMLLAMFLGYAILYFCRKNISASLSLIGNDLGYNNLRLGVLGSTLYVTYGIGKFLNGILADRANIRTFMATGLILSGLCNIWFATLDTLYVLAFAWGLNGWVQSMGFPPIARGLTIWYQPKGKSTLWALWTTSHQAGSAAIMALCGYLLTVFHNDWRMCFIVPGMMCVFIGIFLLWALADTPESQGLPPVKQFAVDHHEEPGSVPYSHMFWKHVICNWQLWVVAITNMCVYVIRFGTLDWMAKFLVDAKHYKPADAAHTAAIIPFAGILGVLISGFASDWIFKGRFKYINSMFLFALLFVLHGFYVTPSPAHHYTNLAFLAMIGFFIEGPQSILGGVASVDVGGSARVASAAAGLVGIFGYIGATLSSIGTGFFVHKFGWAGGFHFWTVCAAVGFVFCTFMWREKSR